MTPELTQEEAQEEKPQCPMYSMEEWMSQEDPHEDDPSYCRPCRLGVTTQWYFSELNEHGHENLAENIEKIAFNEEDPEMPLTLCKEFDRIKSVVEEPLRERLKDFDCATQSFNPDDVAEDSTTPTAEILEEEAINSG